MDEGRVSVKRVQSENMGLGHWFTAYNDLLVILMRCEQKTLLKLSRQVRIGPHNINQYKSNVLCHLYHCTKIF